MTKMYRKDLSEANAFMSSTNAIFNIIGAVLGGIVSTVFSPITCFLVNSLSFLWSAFYVYKIKYQENEKFDIQKQPYFQLLKEGLLETQQNILIRYVIWIGLTWGLVGGGYYILIPVLGNNVYHLGAVGIGALYAIDGLGILLGTYFVKVFIKDNFKRALIIFGISYAVQSLFFVLLMQSTGFYFGSLFLFLMRICGGIIIPLSNYFVQLGTTDEIRGRVFALYNSTYMGVMQISYLVSGYAYEKYSIPVVGAIGGVISMTCGLIWLSQVIKGKFNLIEKV